MDADHGWFVWSVRTGLLSFEVLFKTSDGGRTWTELPSPPPLHLFTFHTIDEGWLLGYLDDGLTASVDDDKDEIQ